jgi:hypothetical protein
MTALDLYKFVHDNNIEANWYNNDVIMFIDFYLLKDLCKLFGTYTLDDDGINCVLKDGYICLWMADICEAEGIELMEIFETK